MNDTSDRQGLDLAATLALALYSGVAALGFGRVFADRDFVSDVLAIVVVGHGLSYLLRRLRVRDALAVPAIVLAVGWLIGWIHYPDTYNAIVPTTRTWDLAWADIGLVREQFADAVAPVVYVGGWALLAGIGTGAAVILADVFAFRAHGRGEALVPGGVLFVFVAALGVDSGRVAWTLALVAAGFLATAVLRVRFARPPRTLLGRSRHPLAVTLPAAAVAGTVVVLGAWAIGPRLPGAAAEPWVDTSSRGGGVTEVVSPLVEIRSRLVNRAPTELFVVRASAPAYWRVAGLPEFNGNSWGLPEEGLERVGSELSPSRPGSVENRQELVITALDGRLVPAAADPVAAAGDGLRFNAATSTLVRVDRTLTRGDRFEIVSAMPSFAADALRATSSFAPPDPIYLTLPVGFPSSVAATAREVTAGATTVYDQMMALQDWFHAEFEYSLDVPQGHSTSAIEAFLRQRIGYCEQFAGTFGAMARTLGVPARVAVGFTPGLAQPDGSFSVLGKNAHAWPEVWFDGLGWVPFEPTPGRGAPGAESHTGLPPDQDDAPPEPGTGAGAEVPAPPPVTVGPTIPPSDEVPDEQAAPATNPVTGTGVVPDRGPPWGVVAAVVAVLGALASLPAAVRWWRRRHPHGDVGRQLVELWQRALSAVETTGFRADPSKTPVEQARAVSPRLPVAARPLRSLADAATAAAFAPPDHLESLHLDPNDPEHGPLRWCRQVERVAAESMTTGGRLRRYFTVWR